MQRGKKQTNVTFHITAAATGDVSKFHSSAVDSNNETWRRWITCTLSNTGVLMTSLRLLPEASAYIWAYLVHATPVNYLTRCSAGSMERFSARLQQSITKPITYLQLSILIIRAICSTPPSPPSVPC